MTATGGKAEGAITWNTYSETLEQQLEQTNRKIEGLKELGFGRLRQIGLLLPGVGNVIVAATDDVDAGENGQNCLRCQKQGASSHYRRNVKL